MEDITIVEVPARQVIGIWKTGSYTLIPELLMKVFEYAVKKNLVITGPPIFICHEISHEAVSDANKKGCATIEVAWPVSGTARGTDEMKIYEMSGGKMVHTIHHGPYDSCERTYERLFAWINERGLRISGPIREIYPNDPREVSPDAIITEIYVPVG
jgi:AraC family transcriptional regulator